MLFKRMLDVGNAIPFMQPNEDEESDVYYADESYADDIGYNVDVIKLIDIKPTTRKRRIELSEAQKGRMALCGTYRKHFEVLTGCYAPFMVRCGRKDCPKCGLRRGKFLMFRVTKPDMMQVSQLTKDTAIELRRVLGKENYVNVPLSDTEDLIFWQPELHPEVIDVAAKKFDEDSFAWAEIQNTPLGYNISGNLNAYEKEFTDTLVVVPQVVCNDPRAQLVDEQAYSAIISTAEALPKDFQELQAAISARTNCFMRKLDYKKIPYTVIFIKQRVEMTKVDWTRSVIETFKYYCARGIEYIGDVFMQSVKKLYASASDIMRFMFDKIALQYNLSLN